MTEIDEKPQERILKIGPDRVTIKDSEVIIEAKRPMPDWQVRELNPPPLYFEENKYYLVEASKTSGTYAMRYLLLPWPAGLSSNSKLFYTYDAEAVAERDAGHRTGQMDEIIRAALLPFYPVLGLFWSGVQSRLRRFGFVPHTLSGISCFLVFCLCFGQGVFATVTINASLRSNKLILGGLLRALSSQDNFHLGPLSISIGLIDCILTAALMADAAMRYSYYLKEHDWSGGFLEWVFRRDGTPRGNETED